MHLLITCIYPGRGGILSALLWFSRGGLCYRLLVSIFLTCGKRSSSSTAKWAEIGFHWSRENLFHCLRISFRGAILDMAHHNASAKYTSCRVTFLETKTSDYLYSFFFFFLHQTTIKDGKRCTSLSRSRNMLGKMKQMRSGLSRIKLREDGKPRVPQLEPSPQAAPWHTLPSSPR